MPYQEIAVEDLESNPFQIREDDNKAVAGIAATAALDQKLGILQAPLVRPYGQKYQIAFGHGRVEAAKLNGYEKIWCRVENLANGDMKKHVLVENVNRQDLSHDELMVGLEQFREELGLEKDFYRELSRKTGIHRSTIRDHYKADKIYQYIEEVVDLDHFKPPLYLVYVVSELPKETAFAILLKASEMSWNDIAVRMVKNAMETLSEEAAQYLIYDKRTRTPHTVIEAVSTLPKEQHMEVAKRIKTMRYNEEDSIALVERVKSGEQIQEITVTDEYTETIKKIKDTAIRIKTWGIAQYAILGDSGWSEACVVFTKIEEQMRYLKLKEWDKL